MIDAGHTRLRRKPGMSELRVVQDRVFRVKHARAPRKCDTEWTSHRAAIEELYAKENRPLKHVIEVMKRRHGFTASRRQYEYHLAQWKISKYNPRMSASAATPAMTPKDATPVATTRTESPLGVPEADVSTTLSSLEGGDDAFVQTNQPTSSEPEWLSSLFTPMLWDSTSMFIEQELAAFNDRNSTQTEQTPEPQSTPADSLMQFADCNFVEDDQVIQHHQHADTQQAPEHSPGSEHHWQTPPSLSRLWEIEIPADQRTAEQQYGVQKLIWCLWLCGNQTCFTNLARGVQYRIVRVEDDISRFETTLEKWIATSLGCPESMLTTTTSTPLYNSVSPASDPARFVSDASLRRGEDGIGDWHIHANIGHHVAILKTTGRLAEAKKISSRLHSELKTAPGQWGFFSSFAVVINILHKVLIKEISNMRMLDADVRKFANTVFGDGMTEVAKSSDISDERKAVGVLALLCHQRWCQDPEFSSERVALIETRTGFPIAKAFQWATRLLLFRSSNGDSTLCARALNGLSTIEFADKQPSERKGILDLEGERLAGIWLDWLSRDSAWFLPSLLPSNITETTTNIWQSILR